MNKHLTLLTIFMVTFLTLAGLLSYVSQFSHKSKATENEVDFSIGPVSQVIDEASESATLLVGMTSETSQKVKGATLKISFDSEKLQVVGTANPPGCEQFPNRTSFSVSQEDKMITWSAESALADDQLPSGAMCFGEVEFAPIGTGEAKVELTLWTGAEAHGPGGPLTPVISSPVATITINPLNHDNDVHLTFISRFQGVAKEPANVDARKMSIKVIAVDEATSLRKTSRGTCAYDSAAATPGSWNCDVYLPVPLSAAEEKNYILLLKGSFHVQKKICGAAPEETEPGLYKCPTAYEGISLNSKEIGYDFSKVTQLAGDLPTQDGIVNSYDTSLARNNLGKGDQEALRLADVNFDGVVNSIDYSLIIAALAMRSDEQ